MVWLSGTGANQFPVDIIATVLVFAGTTCSLMAVRIHLRRLLAARRQGICRNCGYNLKGLQELRCPECGEPFAQTLEQIMEQARQRRRFDA
jgi:predicted amidophosphoribosyltransferase